MVLSKSALNEWRGSGVDPTLFALNVRVLADDAPYAYLLYEINAASGKVHPDAQWRWARKKYGHVEAGGWWCSGLDPLDNWQPMLWGCFKLNSPRNAFDLKGKVKPIKYEHPPKTPTRAFFLQVPDHIWEKVSQRYGVPFSDEDKQYGFWQWVWANNIPVIIVEGAKKAGCLLTLGYAAIALPGVTGGVRTKNPSGDKCDPYLIEELQHFATQEREIYICFDRDTLRQTIQNVNREVDKLGQCFTAAKCPVKIISLPGPEKGVDDFVVAQGEDAFSGLYNAAQAFGFWKTRQSGINPSSGFKALSTLSGKTPLSRVRVSLHQIAQRHGQNPSTHRASPECHLYGRTAGVGDYPPHSARQSHLQGFGN